MKKMITLCLTAFMLSAGSSIYAQTYKTIADSAALNAEYLKVNNDITILTASLDKAKSDQDKEAKRAANATADAQSTADKTSDKADNANGSSVKDAKRAKRQARRSVKDAKQARHAESNLDDANKKVEKLTSQLQKKQDRLKELDNMRVSLGMNANNH